MESVVQAQQDHQTIKKHGYATQSSSRPYAISKTNQEFPLTERKSSSYRRVKLLFLFPLAQGGFYPSHWSVVTGVGFPRTSPSGESLP